MGKSLIFPFFLLVLVCLVATEDEKKNIFHQCKPFPQPFFDAYPFVLEFLRSIAWFFSNLFDALYFVINTVVITSCEVISSVFGCVKYAIKLVEYIGCGVKAVLQLNYNFVSSLFEALAKTARFVRDSVRSFTESIVTGLASLLQDLVNLVHGVINWIPGGLHQASNGGGTSTNATSSLLYQSYLGWKYVLTTPISALLTIASSVRAIVECLLVSVWNTGFLIFELLYSFIASIFLGIEFVGKTVMTCSMSAWNQLIAFSKWLLYGIKAIVGVVAQTTWEAFNAIAWAIIGTLSSVIRGLFSKCSSVYWFVCRSLTELGSFFLNCMETLLNAAALAIRYSPVGRWTLMVLALSGFLPIYSWTVLRVNVFSVAFELLETSVQSVLAFVASYQIPLFSREIQTADQREQLIMVPRNEKNVDLIEQLERERDQNLCVVCQTEKKNIVVMPCRHMCMCKSCCARLFQMQRYHRKTCPICRHVITSTLEIYA